MALHLLSYSTGAANMLSACEDVGDKNIDRLHHWLKCMVCVATSIPTGYKIANAH